MPNNFRKCYLFCFAILRIWSLTRNLQTDKGTKDSRGFNKGYSQNWKLAIRVSKPSLLSKKGINCKIISFVKNSKNKCFDRKIWSYQTLQISLNPLQKKRYILPPPPIIKKSVQTLPNLFKKSLFILVSVILSAHIQRFSVFHMRDLFFLTSYFYVSYVMLLKQVTR